MFASNQRRAALFLILITFIAFISLGLPDGLLDIANPRLRDTFNIGPDVFSLLFLTGLVGYFLSSFLSGQLVARMGIGWLLAASCGAIALAFFGNAVSPAWGWFVAISLLVGAGGGAIDSGLNTYVATNYGPRLMFWLHASFGLGVTGGTWLMSLIVNSGHSWRLGYAIVGSVQIGLALCFFLTRTRWNQPQTQPDEPSSPQEHMPLLTTLRVPVVWLGIALFFLYTGVEVSSGRWSSSLLIEGRDVSSQTAGLWVSIYWGMFTAGRVAAGFVGRWLSPEMFIRLAIGGALLGALLLWWNPVSWAGGAALGLMGLFFAPVFPMLISLTPGRVGAVHAANAIGFEVSAAAVGGTVLPALIGVMAKVVSIDVMPIVVAVSIMALFVLNEIILHSLRTSADRLEHAHALQAGAAGAPGDR